MNGRVLFGLLAASVLTASAVDAQTYFDGNTTNFGSPVGSTNIAVGSLGSVLAGSGATADNFGALNSITTVTATGAVTGGSLIANGSGQGLITIQVANNATNTTAVRELACWNLGTAQTCGNVTTGIIGLVRAGAGTGGSAQIVRMGSALCNFDPTSVAVGDFVVNSPTSGYFGNCHDAGPNYPTNSQPVGVVVATAGFSNPYPVFIFNELPTFSSGGSNISISSSTAGPQFTVSTTASPSFTAVAASGAITGGYVQRPHDNE